MPDNINMYNSTSESCSVKSKVSRNSEFSVEPQIDILKKEWKEKRNTLKRVFYKEKLQIDQNGQDYPKGIFDKIQEDNFQQQDLNTQVKIEQAQYVHQKEYGLVVLHPLHPYLADLTRYEFKYFKVPLKNKEKPLSISLKRIDSHDKFNLTVFTSTVNRNPNVFNAMQKYANVLNIRHTEENNSTYFQSQDLYLSCFCNKDLQLQLRIKYGHQFTQDNNQQEHTFKQQTGEEKINEFLQQKQTQKSALSMMDYETLSNQVDQIYQKRQKLVMEKSSGLNYLKENKKTKQYKPFTQSEKQQVKRVQSAQHLKQVGERKIIIEQQKQQYKFQKFQIKQLKLEQVTNQDYFSNIIKSRQNTSRGGMNRVKSAQYCNNKRFSFLKTDPNSQQQNSYGINPDINSIQQQNTIKQQYSSNQDQIQGNENLSHIENDDDYDEEEQDQFDHDFQYIPQSDMQSQPSAGAKKVIIDNKAKPIIKNNNFFRPKTAQKTKNQRPQTGVLKK